MLMQGSGSIKWVASLWDFQLLAGKNEGVGGKAIKFKQLILIDVKPAGNTKWKFTLRKSIG